MAEQLYLGGEKWEPANHIGKRVKVKADVRISKPLHYATGTISKERMQTFLELWQQRHQNRADIQDHMLYFVKFDEPVKCHSIMTGVWLKTDQIEVMDNQYGVKWHDTKVIDRKPYHIYVSDGESYMVFDGEGNQLNAEFNLPVDDGYGMLANDWRKILRHMIYRKEKADREREAKERWDRYQSERDAWRAAHTP